MNKRKKTFGAFVAISLLVPGCKKENIIDTLDNSRYGKPVFDVEYQFGGAVQTKTLHGDGEYDALLDELMLQVQAGDTVWFSVVGAADPESNPQEPIVFQTTSEREARQWTEQMANRGYTVQIMYNTHTRTYTCTAVWPNHE